MRGSGVPAGRRGSGSESGRRIAAASDDGSGDAPRGSAAPAALPATGVRNGRRLRCVLTILKVRGGPTTLLPRRLARLLEELGELAGVGLGVVAVTVVQEDVR